MLFRSGVWESIPLGSPGAFDVFIEEKRFADLWKEHLSFYVLVTTMAQGYTNEQFQSVFISLARFNGWKVVRLFNIFDISVYPKQIPKTPVAYEGAGFFGVILTESHLAGSILSTTPDFLIQDTNTFKIFSVSFLRASGDGLQEKRTDQEEWKLNELKRLKETLEKFYFTEITNQTKEEPKENAEAEINPEEVEMLVKKISSSDDVFAPPIMFATLKSLFFVEYDLMNYKQENFCYIIGVPSEISEEVLGIYLKKWTGSDPHQLLSNPLESPFIYRAEFQSASSVRMLVEGPKRILLQNGTEHQLWIQPLQYKKDWTYFLLQNQAVIKKKFSEKELTNFERNAVIVYIECNFGKIVDSYQGLEPISMAVTFGDFSKCIRFIMSREFTLKDTCYEIIKPNIMLPLTGKVFCEGNLRYNRTPSGPKRPPEDYKTKKAITVRIEMLKSTKSLKEYVEALLKQRQKLKKLLGYKDHEEQVSLDQQNKKGQMMIHQLTIEKNKEIRIDEEKDQQNREAVSKWLIEKKNNPGEQSQRGSWLAGDLNHRPSGSLGKSINTGGLKLISMSQVNQNSGPSIGEIINKDNKNQSHGDKGRIEIEKSVQSKLLQAIGRIESEKSPFQPHSQNISNEKMEIEKPKADETTIIIEEEPDDWRKLPFLPVIRGAEEDFLKTIKKPSPPPLTQPAQTALVSPCPSEKTSKAIEEEKPKAQEKQKKSTKADQTPEKSTKTKSPVPEKPKEKFSVSAELEKKTLLLRQMRMLANKGSEINRQSRMEINRVKKLLKKRKGNSNEIIELDEDEAKDKKTKGEESKKNKRRISQESSESDTEKNQKRKKGSKKLSEEEKRKKEIILKEIEKTKEKQKEKAKKEKKALKEGKSKSSKEEKEKEKMQKKRWKEFWNLEEAKRNFEKEKMLFENEKKKLKKKQEENEKKWKKLKKNKKKKQEESDSGTSESEGLSESSNASSDESQSDSSERESSNTEEEGILVPKMILVRKKGRKGIKIKGSKKKKAFLVKIPGVFGFQKKIIMTK